MLPVLWSETNTSRQRKKTKLNYMKKYVLCSEEFINENVYCKLDTFRWYSLDKFFHYCLKRITKYDAVLEKYNNRDFDFDYAYYKQNKEDFDYFGFYGVKTDFIQTERGDKFVFELDKNHSFVFYPMCDETADANAARYNAETKLVLDPKYSVLSVYAVSNGKAVKLPKEYNHYFLADYVLSKSSNTKEADELVKGISDFVNRWGLASVYAERTSEFEDVVTATLEADKQRKEEERIRYEKRLEDDRKREEMRNAGVTMSVTYKGNEIYTHQISDINTSIANIKYAFMMNAKYSMENSVSAGVHPDTSDMENLKGCKPYKPVYTPRNLPKDHYELIDYYRTHAGESCQHCDKTPIVNVMVIENSKKEVFHVGNECVRHLVDIPEEEFEEEWNAPFKEASNVMAKIRSDKEKNFEWKWYTYKDKSYYVFSKKSMFDYDIFGENYMSNGRFYYLPEDIRATDKVLKRELGYKTKNVYFMKKMLPIYYANSIEVDINVGDLIDIVYNGKNVNFSNFTYDDVNYKIPIEYEKIGRKYTYVIKKKDFAIGDYSQKFEDAGYGLLNATYKFGDLTIEYRWNG